LIRKSVLEQGREQEVAGPIARENSSSPVAAVCGRRKADDQNAGLGIAEPRDRSLPVFLPREARRRMGRGLVTPCDKTRTPNTFDDLYFDRLEARRMRLRRGSYRIAPDVAPRRISESWARLSAVRKSCSGCDVSKVSAAGLPC
jgi:hypothetical protein